MTEDDSIDVHITSAEEFKEALSTIVEAAIANDVDVRGTWEFFTRGSVHNWEVEVVELVKEFDDDVD